jgi:hypothetical protein
MLGTLPKVESGSFFFPRAVVKKKKNAPASWDRRVQAESEKKITHKRRGPYVSLSLKER